MGLKKTREGTYVVKTLKSKHGTHGTCNIQYIAEATLTAVTVFFIYLFFKKSITMFRLS